MRNWKNVWLAAHLIWAEDFLVVRATGGKGADIPWLEHYKLGSDGTLHEEKPDMKNLLSFLKQGHENAMAHLLSLTDEKLSEENPLGFGFGGIGKGSYAAGYQSRSGNQVAGGSFAGTNYWPQ